MSRRDEVRAALGGMLAVPGTVSSLSGELAGLRTQLGGLEARSLRALSDGAIREAEFSVFSQFGEDGIIQFLVQRVPIENEVFVEFGVEDYHESNTRFLLVHDNWRGLIIDGGAAHDRFLQDTTLAWRHQVDAITAFIDRDNINGLIAGAGIEGDIGLLSIDLDGNDYWILETIDVVSPRILVVEYNSTFGPEAAVTVPYDARFVRGEKHPSWLYWGASLAALQRAADRKGYALVGGNRAGNNAFFVRRDVLEAIPEVSVKEAYAPSRFRESRGADGQLSYVSGHRDRLELIADTPIYDVDSGATVSVRERLLDG
ncbi:MAG TPA: hypothetical protein VGC98_07155 [Thermoleophilaceae bacterium]|jgi:hypothetical protein